jgi:hypothetical protein
MFLLACEPRWDESAAFPFRLNSAVREAAALVATGEMHRPRHAFLVNVDHETLQIPYRLYYSPALLRRELSHSLGVSRLILACLGTRHYDGYLRQECLGELLGSDEAWLTPYILQLAGEYVVEIAENVVKAIGVRDTGALATFATDNPDYLATLARRVQSYWYCYYREAYPHRNNYPGVKVLALLRHVLQ